MLRMIFAIAVILAGLAGQPSAAADAIGSVSRLQGFSTGTIAGVTQALQPDASVFLDETVSTGPGARLEVSFSDGTTLTLGEQAVLTLDAFVYDPAQGLGNVKLGIVGAFRFVSGQAAKLASADVAVTTPVATVGIRGTDFWGGPIDGEYGVFLAEGAVSVTNAGGEVVLDQPGQGTNIIAPGVAPGAPAIPDGGRALGPESAPGAVTTWEQDKVDRAIATVTFQ